MENLENPKKTYCFFWSFPAFLEKSKKTQGFFFDFEWFYSKNPKTYCFFFGFSMILLLENLENPKKPIVVFGLFRLFLKIQKKPCVFWIFQEKPEK